MLLFFYHRISIKSCVTELHQPLTCIPPTGLYNNRIVTVQMAYNKNREGSASVELAESTKWKARKVNVTDQSTNTVQTKNDLCRSILLHVSSAFEIN
jgi:hypothetical protein